MLQVFWSPQALHDLRMQFSYLLGVDTALAARPVAAIDARADWIADQPLLGTPFGRRSRKSLVPELPFLIIYRIDGRSVRILRIRHMAEDWLPR